MKFINSALDIIIRLLIIVIIIIIKLTTMIMMATMTTMVKIFKANASTGKETHGKHKSD